MSGKISFFFTKSIPNCYEYLDSALKLNQEVYAQNGLAATANLFVKRDVFSSIGLFDDTLLSGGDMDFTSRASSEAFCIRFDPNILIFHPARNNLDEILIKCLRVSRSTVVKHNTTKKSKSRFYRICPPRPKIRLPKNNHTNYRPNLAESLYIVLLINLRSYISYILRFI